MGQVVMELGAGDGPVPVLFAAVLTDRERERRRVQVDVQAIAVPREGRVDGLSRRTIICEQKDAIRGQALRAGDGRGVAVLETDVAVHVAGLVGVERHRPPILGGRGDAHALLSLVAHDGDRVDAEDGTVEEPMGKERGAHPDGVTHRDLQGYGLSVSGLSG